MQVLRFLVYKYINNHHVCFEKDKNMYLNAKDSPFTTQTVINEGEILASFFSNVMLSFFTNLCYVCGNCNMISCIRKIGLIEFDYWFPKKTLRSKL